MSRSKTKVSEKVKVAHHIFQESNLLTGPPKSIMSSMSLTTISNNLLELRRVMGFLAGELSDRLRSDQLRWNRRPRTFVFAFRLVNERESSHSVPFGRLLERDKKQQQQLQQQQQDSGEVPLASSSASSDPVERKKGLPSSDAMVSVSMEIFNGCFADRPCAAAPSLSALLHPSIETNFFFFFLLCHQ